MKNIKKGFTLIELLVVIAIIALLSSVILASLNSARGKASDASIKQNLTQIRAQAAIVFDNNVGSYTTPTALFATGSKELAMLNAASVATSGDFGVSSSAWAAWVVLKTDPTKAWCVDSTGASRRTTSTYIDGSTVCSAAI